MGGGGGGRSGEGGEKGRRMVEVEKERKRVNDEDEKLNDEERNDGNCVDNINPHVAKVYTHLIKLSVTLKHYQFTENLFRNVSP